MSERALRRQFGQTQSFPMPARLGGAASHAAHRGGALFKLVVFLSVVFAFGALAWMLLLPVVVTSQLRARTGFDASIKRLTANPLAGTISASGFVITNPPTYSVPDFFELREFRVNAELFSLFTERPVFNTMKVDIAKVTLVKRKDGATNAEAFKKNLETSREGKPRALSSENPRPFLIRRLDLQLDELVIVDQSRREPRVQEFTLGINQTYADVTDLTQLLEPKTLASLAPIAMAASGLLPGDFGKALKDAAKSGTDVLKEAGRATTASAKRLFDALEESKKP